MKVLTVLTYYRPHTSGLTIYAERLARALVQRGHQVTVMTTQYDPSLPLRESMDGVEVVRVPVLARLSKGVIAPTFGWHATRLVLAHDVVHLHLPQFDAPGVAARARLFGKRAILTYHCDLRLPPGRFNRVVNSAVHLMNHLSATLAHQIVTYTRDYADHSSFLARYSRKLVPILPPVQLPEPPPGAIAAAGRLHDVASSRPVIGMAARFAAEKGVEVLLAALPAVLERYPQAQVLFAGQHENVLGEQAYAARLMPRINDLQLAGHWTFLGNLDPLQMSAFYPNLDVLVLPSLNSTEAFGLVQVEAMLKGVPCVVADLPGVRQPVLMHGMGRVFAVGDSHALAQVILAVLDGRALFIPPGDLAGRYAPDTIAHAFEQVFQPHPFAVESSMSAKP
jgi:glycosyltransferase involved in cell wall biosynthesis